MSVSAPETGIPRLVIDFGDCEFYAQCGHCGKPLGTSRPDQSFDTFTQAWERHSILECEARA